LNRNIDEDAGMAKFEIVSMATGNVIAVTNSNRMAIDGAFIRKCDAPSASIKASALPRKQSAKIGSKVRLFSGHVGVITAKSGLSYTISVDGKPNLYFARDTFEVIG
jgi:hypothetical protein